MKENKVGSETEIDLFSGSNVLLLLAKLITSELKVKASYMKDSKVR